MIEILLYLLGCYMHYQLAGNIRIERMDKEDFWVEVAASLFWPFVSVFFFVKKVILRK